MHEKNIVHLDLKPENILLVSPDSDDLKVIDFGLARVVSPDRDVICKFGTPEFVAPEVVCKQPVSTASDVWSIGVMAYILLSGMSPFMGDDDKQTLMKVKRGYWDFDDEVWDSISDEAKEFLKAVLVLDPKKRLSLDQCLQHSWLKFDERHDQGVAKLSTQRLKTFNSRRKWQKALTAVKSAMRLRRLSSIAASDINAFRQRHLQGKSHGQSTDSQNKDDKTPQADGEGRDDTQGETGMGYGFMVCTEEDEAAGILPLPCIIDDSMGTDDDENPACLVVPSLMAQSFVGHPLHVTSTQSTSCVGLSTETTGMRICDVSHSACVCLYCACHLDNHPASFVEHACLHELSCVQCCDCRQTGVPWQFVKKSQPKDGVHCCKNADLESVDSKYITVDQGNRERPDSETSEDIPVDQGNRERPDSETSEDIPVDQGYHERPDSETSEDIPVDQGYHERPDSETSEDIPGDQGYHERPDSETSEDIPVDQGYHERPDSETNEDIPVDQGYHERPDSETSEDVPVDQGYHERPDSETSEDTPVDQGYHERPDSETSEDITVDQGYHERPDSETSEDIPVDQGYHERPDSEISERQKCLPSSMPDEKCISTSLTLCRLLSQLAYSPEECMSLLRDSLQMLSETRDCEEIATYDLDRTKIDVVNSADLTAVFCEREIPVDSISVSGNDIVMAPMTTLAGFYTERVPDLDLGAVPPSEASAELTQMERENGVTDETVFTFDVGVNGEMSNRKENEGIQACAMSVGKEEPVKRKIGKIGWSSILGNIGKNVPAQTSEAQEMSGVENSPEKPVHPGTLAFSKRKWSKSKLVLPSSLRRIQENRALSTEEVPPASSSNPEKQALDHNSNNSTPLPRRLSSKWSKESMDSVDFGDEEEIEVEEHVSVSPEVMAVDSRHSAEKKRWNLRNEGASSAQIFGKEPQPKLVGITELMLKINRDNKRKESEKNGASSLDPQRLSPTDGASLTVGTSPEVGRLRAVSFNTSQEIEVKGHLDFLVCEVDDRLNLGRIETWMLLRYNQLVRFIAGVIIGMFFAVVCRIIF